MKDPPIDSETNVCMKRYGDQTILNTTIQTSKLIKLTSNADVFIF